MGGVGELGGGGGVLPYFTFISCSADHERIGHRVKKYLVVFFGLATNTLNVRNNFSALHFSVYPSPYSFKVRWYYYRH